MATRSAACTVVGLLVWTAAGWAVAGPAAATPPPPASEERIGFADATLDGTDPRTGRTVHGVFSVFDPPDERPFGTTDFFVGGDTGDGEGIVYECVTEQRTPARLDQLRSASAVGVLRMTCASPVGLPTRTGHALVGVGWRGEGPVESLVFQRENCTEHLDVRPATVTGGVVLVVPGVAVAAVTPHDHPADELRQQRVVCR